MSRNSEKAQSLLNRYQAQQYSLPNTRPKSTKRTTNLKDAERFRHLVVQEISQKLTKINDQLINEYQIRDFNDQLNDLQKEKTRWEYRIKELGGPDYLQFNNRSSEGSGGSGELIIKGYRYFGRAKELTDVKELIEATKQEKKRLTDLKLKNKNDRLEFNRVNNLEFSLEYYGSTASTEETYHTDYGISTEQDVIDQVREILGNDALPENILTNSKLQELNSPRIVSTNDDPLLKFERRKTRNLQKNVPEASTDVNSVEFDEFGPPVDSKEIETTILKKQKEQLLAELNSK